MLVTILMTKNEEDIITACLCDRLHKFDLIAIVDSSTDGTTAICKDILERYPDQVVYKYDDQPHTIKHHREVCFNLLKGKISDDDWIWQLDTDIYFDFSKEDIIGYQNVADLEGANCMVCKIAQFYPTPEDINSVRHWSDFKYYSLNWQSKIVYKGLSGLYFKGANQETPTTPNEKKAIYRPVVKHYQYRNPDQIQTKIDRAFGIGAYSHIISKKWQDYIIDRDFLSKWEDNSHRRPHHSWRSLVSLTKEKNETS